LGKKVKKLREEGLLPAHIFGAQTEPVNIEVDYLEFVKVFRETGETGLVNIQIEGEQEPRPVLVVGVQSEPVVDKYIHVDFHQVVMTEEVEVGVPLVIEEESAPAVRDRKGILLTQVEEIVIRALPGEIPENIIVDLSQLQEVGDAVYIKDVALPAGVELISDPEQVIAAIESTEAPEEEEEKPGEEAVPEESAPEAPPGKEKEPGKENTEEAETEPAKAGEKEKA
jgi:large subunit ribosomal protein L25